MTQITRTTKTTTCLLFFSMVFFYIFISSVDRTIISPSRGYASSILPLLVVFLIAFLIVLAVRTTVMTWITVLVLLAFAGKCRRVLAKEGRKITSDVAMYLVYVLFKEKSIVAFVCAAIFSLMAISGMIKSS